MQTVNKPGHMARGRVKSLEISARVIRANGTVENLGVIARWPHNWISKVSNFIRRLLKTWQLC